MSNKVASGGTPLKIWQVEWYVGTSLNTPTLRQFFETGEAAVKFKQSLVQAAALLGTCVSATVSEFEVKQ